ncbi:DUF1402 family protein [Deinococcus rubellus]|uniref:DUF1402 family protein n=1 Tax=Deinococcus rubellus TaxID=1889240 RepID=A0ABY5YEA5_9DEIO|nr:DUF1402 family protein [Deinococcus rubellus]UWX62722.1 DUF1402 family protein [Deinococcus rubellus]
MNLALDFQARRAAEDQALTLAARRYGVDAGLVAAILADEAARWGVADQLQHGWARLICALPARPAQHLINLTEPLLRRPLGSHSLGRAQMKLATLHEVARSGLLSLPARPQEQVRMLLDPQAAPSLVAARLRQTLDHWQADDVDLTRRPEILGTLYSLGLSGQAGVHPHPQLTRRGLKIAAVARQYRARQAHSGRQTGHAEAG